MQMSIDMCGSIVDIFDHIIDALNQEIWHQIESPCTNHKGWLGKMPFIFPECMGYHSDNTPYQNPMIGDTQESTFQNIEYILNLFISLALPNNAGPASLALDESETRGYVLILEALIGAMKFEEKYRPDGGKSMVESLDK